MKNILKMIFPSLFLGFPSTAIVINGSGSIQGTQEESITVNGSGDFSKTKINQDLIINGSGNVDDCQIAGTLDVNGSLFVQNSTANALNVNGSFSAKNIKIPTKTSVHGVFEAKDSIFSEIEVSSTLVTLENCTADVITVSKNMGSKQQIVEIKGTSKIQKIIFESGEGVIKKSAESVVETIKGGTVQ